MVTNEAFWSAIDKLALANKLSCSRMSKLGGMDATTLNKSKRVDAYGKPRWLSVWSLLKLLDATHTSWAEFEKYLLSKDEAPKTSTAE